MPEEQKTKQEEVVDGGSSDIGGLSAVEDSSTVLSGFDVASMF